MFACRARVRPDLCVIYMHMWLDFFFFFFRSPESSQSAIHAAVRIGQHILLLFRALHKVIRRGEQLLDVRMLIKIAIVYDLILVLLG